MPTGKHYKEMRERLGFPTQKDMATFFNVTIGAVSSWEKGKRSPQYGIIEKLLCMGASVQELFGVDYEAIQIEKGPKSALHPVESNQHNTNTSGLTVEIVRSMINDAIERDRRERSKAVG